MNVVLYIKADNMIRVDVPEVRVSDLGQVWCRDISVLNRCRDIRLFQMHSCRKVVSIIDVVKAVEEQCPGVTVSSLGEQDFVVEYKPAKKHIVSWEYAKFLAVWLIVFCGSAFAIASFNEDAGVSKIFAAFHQMITGEERNGLTWLEAGYAAGISGGILVFYNHISRKKEYSDPTPLDVEMRTYEKELYSTMIDDTNRRNRAQPKKGQRNTYE